MLTGSSLLVPSVKISPELQQSVYRGRVALLENTHCVRKESMFAYGAMYMVGLEYFHIVI